MPWMVKTYRKRGGKPKRFGMSTLFSEHEIQNLAADPDGCYKIINTTSRRVSSVGGACKRPTPPNLWGLWPFGKKKAAKPKQLPRDPRKMARTYIVAPGGGPGGVIRPLYGARRRRRRR